MPVASRASRIATSQHRRFRQRWRTDEALDTGATSVSAVEPFPPHAVPINPDVQELAEAIRRRIHERWTSPEHWVFLRNDLNHVRRYALSLSWIPDGAGLVLDPASGVGHFSEILRDLRRYRLETPAFFNPEKTSPRTPMSRSTGSS